MITILIVKSEGNFLISEGEALSPVISDEGKIAPQHNYSNIDEIVEQE